MIKFHHVFCWGNFGETDSIPIISQRGNENFRFPSISHRNLSISISIFLEFLRSYASNDAWFYQIWLVVSLLARENPRGALVIQGDVPVAKFRVSNSAIYYLLGSKNFQIYYRFRVVKIDMISLWRFKKV